MLAVLTTRAQLPFLQALQHLHFFDLRVYRQAASVVNGDHSLYGLRLRRGLAFTYPPFAALCFVPLSWLSVHRTELLVAMANILLVAATAHAVIRLPRPTDARPVGSAAGWLIAAVALWTQPVSWAIGYGQIDLLIAALVTVDLAYGSRTRLGGIGIGLAAALKLTPLIFIPYLLFSGRRAMAGRATGTFLLSIAVGLAAMPRATLSYWGGRFLNVSHLTGRHHAPGGGPADQSLRGALMRLLEHGPLPNWLWLLACLLVGLTGLLLAVRAARRGDHAWGFLLTAVTGLLISPVSWTHHWAIAVPGVLALLAGRRRSFTLPLLAALVAGFMLDGYAIYLVSIWSPTGLHLEGAVLLVSDLYVLGGLGTLLFAAGNELRSALPKTKEPAINSFLRVLLTNTEVASTG